MIDNNDLTSVNNLAQIYDIDFLSYILFSCTWTTSLSEDS